MSKSTGDNTKTRSKRAPETGILVGTRFQAYDLGRIDKWIAEKGPPFVSRPEAVRRLVEKGLDAK